MKIMIMNGSLRKNGATGRILNRIGEIISQHEEVEVDYVNLADLQMEYCKGCEMCYKNGRCIFDDDTEKLARRMRNVDAVILGSPTYAGNVSGLMKTFIDRGHFVMEQALTNKYAVVLATGENYGKRDVVKILGKLILYSGGRICGSVAVNIPFNENPDCDRKLQRKIERVSQRLYWSVRKKKRYLIQEFVHKVVFEVGIKRFVLKRAEKYAGVMKMWEKSESH